MKKTYLLIILFICNAAVSVKAEHFFNFYFHQINLDDYPLVKLVGIVESYNPEEVHEILNREDLALYENDRQIEKVFFDYLDIKDNRIVFEISYRTPLPKVYNRSIYVSDLAVERTYYFDKEGKLTIPQESYTIAPKGFIPTASFFSEEYFSNNPNVKRYVLAKQGIEIKEFPNRDAKNIGHIHTGESISISKENYGEVYDGQLFEQSLYGSWRKVSYNDISGYVLDTYLSILPAREEQGSELEVFLQGKFGMPQAFDVDRHGDELLSYGNWVIYNKTQKRNEGYIYFNGLDDQEFYIIIQNWFYDENFTKVYIEEQDDSREHIELRDILGYTVYDFSNTLFQVEEDSVVYWVYPDEMRHSVRYPVLENSKF